MTEPIPWSSDTPDDWADTIRALPWVEDRAGGTVRGWKLVAPCPTCRHEGAIDLYQASSIISSFAVDGLSEILATLIRQKEHETSETLRPVACDCGQDHPGRPADKTGCGRSAEVPFTIGARSE